MVIHQPEVLTETPLPTRSALDETRGRLCFDANSAGLDPNQRLTLATLSIQLGQLLGPRLFVNSISNDPEINVEDADVARISNKSLRRGLYISSDDPRYAGGEQLFKFSFQAGVREARTQQLKLPFETTLYRQPAVVLGSSDYLALNNDPQRTINKIRSRTRRANTGRTNVAEVSRRTNSSVGQAMAGYLVKTETVLERYQKEASLTRRLYKQVRGEAERGGTPQNQYKVKNLDTDRKQFDVLFHDLIEVAAINNNWTTHDVHAAHKASVAERYRSGSSEESNNGWRRQLGIFGLYNNARIFKALQSLRACEVYSEMYRPFIREVIESAAAR